MKWFIFSSLMICAYGAHAGVLEWLGLKSEKHVGQSYISTFAQDKWKLKADSPTTCAPYFAVKAEQKGDDIEYKFGKSSDSDEINGSFGNLMPLVIGPDGEIKNKHTKESVQGDLVLEAKRSVKFKDEGSGVATIRYKAQTHFGDELAKILGQQETDISFKILLDPLKEELTYINEALEGKPQGEPCVYESIFENSTSNIVDSGRVFGAEDLDASGSSHESRHRATGSTRE